MLPYISFLDMSMAHVQLVCREMSKLVLGAFKITMSLD